MPDLTDDIESAAAEPQSSSGDGQSATAHSLKDMIEADKYLKAVAATDPTTSGVKSLWGRVRMARAVPPGATGEA